MLQFVDKKIEVRHGKCCVFSMWEGVGVGRKGGIILYLCNFEWSVAFRRKFP